MRIIALAIYLLIVFFTVAMFAGGSQRSEWEDRLDHEDNVRRMRRELQSTRRHN